MLTSEQEQAVLRRHGPLALTAGAGSGKTSVLVERFVRAVDEDGVSPGRILAITFTERAAGELRERIRERLLALGRREGAREAEAAFVGTFHGFCSRLLREHPLSAGVDPRFKVIDEGVADRLRKAAFGEALTGFFEGGAEEPVELAAAYGVAQLEKLILDVYGTLRSKGETLPRLPQASDRQAPQASGDRQAPQPCGDRQAPMPCGDRQAPQPCGDPQAPQPCGDPQALQTCALLDELLRRFGEAYAARKRRRSALDFDDLELFARELLRQHETTRRAWAERFAMVMVDELQDTNPRQVELLALLERDNLFTVGDELQSIYGFRHADVELFRERRERLERDGAALALTSNFRSRSPILAAVDRVFRGRLGEGYTPLTPTRDAAGGEPAVELLLTDSRGWQTGSEDGGPAALGGEAAVVGQALLGSEAELSELPDATPWRVAEARLLAARVASLLADGAAQPGEVAVLLRGVKDLPLYETALRLAGVPTLAATGGFWGHRQVGDLLACLRALANPLDEPALYSTLASPLVGLSSDGLVAVARAAKARGCRPWQAIERHGEEIEGVLPVGEGERLRAFGAWLAQARSSLPLTPLPDLLRGAVETFGYDAHVLALRWGERRLANVNKLVRLARAYEAEEGRDLRGFLDHASHLGEVFDGREPEAPAGEGQREAVQLMSVHAAKGLEFDVVCVADLGRTPSLRSPDLIVGRDGRLGVKLRVLGDPEARPALDYERLSAEAKAAQQAEEDRILYVAMTRARERLILSGAADLARWPSPRQGCAPIAWLAPALVPDLQALLPAGDESIREVDAGLSLRCVFNRPADSPARPGDSPARPGGLPARPGGLHARPGDSPTLPGVSVASPRHASMADLDRAWPTVRRMRKSGEQSPVPTPLSDSDATISYSFLAELERCGYRHYLERVLHLPEKKVAAGVRLGDGGGLGDGGRLGDGGGLDPRVRGTVVHLALERIDLARLEPPSLGQLAALARTAGIRLSPAQRGEIGDLLARALAAPPAGRLADCAEVRRELPFAFSLGAGEPLVTGVFDLLARERDGGLLVVDYKSDRVLQDADLEEVVCRDYGLQRLLYGLAALEQGAERVEVAHWFLERPQSMVSATFLAGERPALRERLQGRLDELRAKGFTVAERPHRGLCLSCPGRGGLCSWPQDETMRERAGGPIRAARLATLTP